jgi:upstream activation factor subunit UAF30
MVRTSKSTASAAPKKSTKKEATPAPTPTPAPEPVVETAPAPVAVVEEVSVESKLAEFSTKLQQALSIFSTLKSDYKTLVKTVEREMKVARKASKKRRSVAPGDRKPSGFTAPTRISDELAIFLNKEVGTEMARTSVSKEIHQYIQANGLARKDNGRFIIPDDKLCKILNCTKTDEISYFNLQTYLKPHFKKKGEE